MVKGHNLNVGDVVRNKYVPALIGTIVEDRGDGVVRVKVGDNPSVFDVGACWERIKSMAGERNEHGERIKSVNGDKED